MTELEKQKLLENTGISEFKNRLSLAQEGMSGNSFAKKVGMSEAVIRDYLSGKTYPSLNRLAIIAEKCDLPIEWLATGKGGCRLLKNNATPNIIDIPPHPSVLSYNNEKSNQKTNTTFPFDLSYIKHHNFNITDLYTYRAKGDSMSPTISAGDMLILNTASTLPFDGYIYAVEYGDTPSIKRIQNSGKQFLLLSDNEKYPVITIDKLNIDVNFNIIGQVICILKDLS
ncbi:LexA family transcriptional regulator [Orbus mooreae]|uniref:LexA family transcriptional regulator n=1 Tax=Orbus mooreae TaxID=3074107 RepID=UPI00370D5F61